MTNEKGGQGGVVGVSTVVVMMMMMVLSRGCDEKKNPMHRLSFGRESRII